MKLRSYRYGDVGGRARLFAREVRVESDIISLQPLYDFQKDYPGADALNGRSAVGRAYSGLARRVTESIASAQGFYLWGYYETNGLWRNVYLGRAGFGATAHLRSRICEELKDERCFIWRRALSEEELMTAGARHYPSMWHQYEKHWRRALRKAKSSHIAWVADSELSNAAVANIESDLIETLNPIHNVSRPIPPVSLQEHTHNVVQHFRRAIHSERGRRDRPK